MNLKKYRRIVRTYASSSFSELKEKKKGDKTLTRGKNKKIIINKTVYILSQTRVFSPWEENIIKRIENAGFTTERKFKAHKFLSYHTQFNQDLTTKEE